jgi:transposase
MPKKQNNKRQIKNIDRQLGKIKDTTIKNRLMMVKRYYQLKSYRDVGDEFVCDYNKVRNWKLRWEEFGIKGMETKKQTGRPRAVGNEKYQEIKSKFTSKDRNQGWETKQIKEYIRKETGKSYCIRQIQRIVSGWGYSLQKGRPIYAHTNKKNRAEFLKKTAES